MFDSALVSEMRKGVPAGQLDIGPNARSGLGVEFVETMYGTAYGHGGFFPKRQKTQVLTTVQVQLKIKSIGFALGQSYRKANA